MNPDEITLTLSELLDQAAAAASVGDQEEAERLYRRATERSPANSRAWLGLASAVQDPEEKQACLETVLEIHPHNGEARAALERLGTTVPPPPPEAAGNGTPSAITQEHDDHDHIPVESDEVLFCANHPTVETTLRCNRCGKPVCTQCVELTEVGYRCKTCIREQQNVFFNAVNGDYVIVAIVSFLLAAIAAPIIGLLFGMFGLFFGLIIAFFLGPAVGGAAATLIRRSVSRRRGRHLGAVAVVGIILGMVVGTLLAVPFGIGINLLPLGLFLFLALSTIYAALR
ncbi:MAG: tetratricopeptide repeat protein [Chloroflexota bacterium]|nr:tetratricopeptide repeat protein [Chloroflexota bacterium]